MAIAELAADTAAVALTFAPAMLAEQGIDDVKTLLLYSVHEQAEEVGLKGGHARKPRAHCAQLDGARIERS